jgi:outer membrane receptor protein involved in Fe transport
MNIQTMTAVRGKRSFKRALAAATMLASMTGAILLAGEASAQQTTGLDVVTVTANLREENLQDVPLSAANLSEDALESIFQGGEDVLALSARVPGLYAESSNGRVAPRFYIRGLGNTDFDLAASQPVSVIMDDVVMENVVLKSTPLFDLANVQVYRGPQGTLFGRNTTAGIVRFTSARPNTDAFAAKANLSWGTFNSVSADGAVNIPIGDIAAVRISALYQHRDDWIDNTVSPTDGDDLGGFDELATRVQLLVTPTDKLDMLFNVHTRDLDGTAAIFRGNVITKGTTGLNSNYDRRRVSYDGGGGNPQKYEGWGASANIGYDFGDVTLTSISAYETTNGSSRGDIDGGPGPYDFDFSGPFPYPSQPFPSDTTDGLDDLDQFTQELRLASDTAGPFKWQVGAFYFDSEFTITTIGGPVSPATLTHSNTSWAVYGQGTYDFTDALHLTVGARYTDDDKDVVVPAAPANNRSVSDDHVSWEASLMYDLTPGVSVYGRVADGFRGPSIQARDVAFFLSPSVAQSETILSFEAGWKTQLLDNTLRFNGAVYTYEVSDMQLTVVGGAGNTVQLRNADTGKAWGFETDVEWEPIENLILTGGLSYVDTEIDDAGLGTAICGQCTITDPVVGGFAQVDGNPFPNSPELIADFTARYSMPWGNGGEIFAFTDWSYQGKTNIFLYESVEFQTDDQFEGGLRIGYARTDGSWEAAIFARNITDEDNIKGAIDFNNNTAFVNDPRIVGVSLRFNR